MAEAPRGTAYHSLTQFSTSPTKLISPPAAHIEDDQPVFSPRTYRVFSYGLLILLVVGLVVVVGIAFVKNKESSQKRYF